MSAQPEGRLFGSVGRRLSHIPPYRARSLRWCSMDHLEACLELRPARGMISTLFWGEAPSVRHPTDAVLPVE
jgi:hypothetical protein